MHKPVVDARPEADIWVVDSGKRRDMAAGMVVVPPAVAARGTASPQEFHLPQRLDEGITRASTGLRYTTLRGTHLPLKSFNYINVNKVESDVYSYKIRTRNIYRLYKT